MFGINQDNGGISKSWPNTSCPWGQSYEYFYTQVQNYKCILKHDNCVGIRKLGHYLRTPNLNMLLHLSFMVKSAIHVLYITLPLGVKSVKGLALAIQSAFIFIYCIIRTVNGKIVC